MKRKAEIQKQILDIPEVDNKDDRSKIAKMYDLGYNTGYREALKWVLK